MDAAKIHVETIKKIRSELGYGDIGIVAKMARCSQGHVSFILNSKTDVASTRLNIKILNQARRLAAKKVSETEKINRAF